MAPTTRLLHDPHQILHLHLHLHLPRLRHLLPLVKAHLLDPNNLSSPTRHLLLPLAKLQILNHLLKTPAPAHVTAELSVLQETGGRSSNPNNNKCRWIRRCLM